MTGSWNCSAEKLKLLFFFPEIAGPAWQNYGKRFSDVFLNGVTASICMRGHDRTCAGQYVHVAGACRDRLDAFSAYAPRGWAEI